MLVSLFKILYDYQVLQPHFNLDFSTGNAPPWTGSVKSANSVTIATTNTKLAVVVILVIAAALNPPRVFQQLSRRGGERK